VVEEHGHLVLEGLDVAEIACVHHLEDMGVISRPVIKAGAVLLRQRMAGSMVEHVQEKVRVGLGQVAEIPLGDKLGDIAERRILSML
jgi:hypothetical protein